MPHERLTGRSSDAWPLHDHPEFRALFNAAAMGMALLDERGCYLAVNEHLHRMLGYSADELNAMPLTAILGADDAEVEAQLRASLLAGKVPYFEIELEACTKDRRTLLLHQTVSRLPSLDGDGPVMLCMVEDITERRRVEAELKASEARWRCLVEHAPDYIVVLDLDYRLGFINRRRPPSTVAGLLGQDGLQFVMPEEREGVKAALDRVVRTRQPARLALQVRQIDGQLAWYEVSIGPFVEDDRVAGLMVIARDVTEKRRVEDELREKRLLLAAAEEIARIGSWEMYLDPPRLIWSDGFYRLLGLEPGSVEPSLEVYRERLHPGECERYGHDYDRYVGEGGDIDVERRIVTPAGHERLLLIQGHIESDEQGKPFRAIGVARDVTEQRQLERIKDEFVSVVSHELRTPLTAICGALGMLAHGTVDLAAPEGRKLLEVALRNTERMRRLVNDIFDYNRLETGRMTINKEETDAAELLSQAVDPLRPLIESAGLSVTIDAAPAAVWADSQRIIQVLTNLLENAIAFSPRGGTLRVGSRREDGVVRFCVRDEGPGIPESEQTIIFERFKQLDPSVTRRKGGTGLGLAISRSIVDEHGGRLWVESRPGEGSTFCFVLPALDQPTG